jgi:hypothetical protein
MKVVKRLSLCRFETVSSVFVGIKFSSVPTGAHAQASHVWRFF